MRVPLNSWFIRENAIEMDDWGVPLFQETLKYVQIVLWRLKRFKTLKIDQDQSQIYDYIAHAPILQGLGLMSLSRGFVSHHQTSQICWKFYLR